MVFYIEKLDPAVAEATCRTITTTTLPEWFGISEAIEN